MTRYKNQELARMYNADGQAIIKELKQYTNTLKPQLSEEIFVNKYLPILTARQLKDQDGNVVPVDLRHWLEVSGNPSMPVDIVDASGNVLFEVPPLLRSGKTSTKQQGKLSMGAVGDVFSKMVETNPNTDRNFISNHYFEKVGHTDISADRETWIAILKRYNLLHTLIGVDAEPIVSDNTSSTTSDAPIDPSEMTWEDF